MAGKDINVPGKCMPPEKGEPMGDYIDRKDLLEDLERFAPEGKAALLIVKKQKSVDAVPVAHGRWMYFHKRNIAVCTNCSFERNLDANFGKAVGCPNCGAKMDLEVE